MSLKIQFANPGTELLMPLGACQDNEYEEVGWGIQEYGGDFSKITINRPKVGEYDVKLDLQFCGICHSDIHIVSNEVPGTMYPIVPGHELAGIVAEVGDKVTKVKVGDKAAVGCIKDSCLECGNCNQGDENYCDKGYCHTYNSRKLHGHTGGNQDTQNFGGYSGSDVVHEHFVFKLPDSMPLEMAGPLLCAGITMWDPLRHWGATKGDKKMNIGIVGIGGLGTMGIKLAAALGHRVVAISSSDRKQEVASSKGAEGYVVSTDNASVAAAAGSLDLILNTVPNNHNIAPYLQLLNVNGVLVQLGLVFAPHSVSQIELIMRRKSIAGSLIGGVVSTAEMLQFCADKEVYPDIEVVTAERITEVYCKLQGSNSDSLRYVLDIKESLKQ